MGATSHNEPDEDLNSGLTPQLSLLRMQQMREEIDTIDDELIQLLLQRLEIADSLGNLKRELKLAVKDSSREEAVLEKVAKQSDHSHLKDHLVSLYKAIMDESCKIQTADN